MVNNKAIYKFVQEIDFIYFKNIKDPIFSFLCRYGIGKNLSMPNYHKLSKTKLLNISTEFGQYKLKITGRVDANDFYYRNLKSYIEENQLNEKIIFLGNLNEGRLKEEYDRVPLLVLPSKAETAPMVIARGYGMRNTDCRFKRWWDTIYDRGWVKWIIM